LVITKTNRILKKTKKQHRFLAKPMLSINNNIGFWKIDVVLTKNNIGFSKKNDVWKI